MHPIQFISLGPGDPELITLKAYKQLQKADLIFCPSTPKRGGVEVSHSKVILQALEIEEEHIQTFSLPMQKNREAAFAAYQQVYIQAIAAYKNEKRVAIVAEGDVGFYASIHRIYDQLNAEHYPVAQIAGIPAFIAAGATAGLQIVEQEERLTVIPGIVSVEELLAFIEKKNTVVIMKLSQCRVAIHEFISRYPTHRYHYFEYIGTERHYETNEPENIRTKEFPYFSLLIIQPHQK